MRSWISILKMVVMNADFLSMIEYASKAPSGHNTQPWRFALTGDGMVILPKFEVALPVVDADNRELFISLGCALENLLISARHFGYKARVVGCNPEGIEIRCVRDENVAKEHLFYQIEKRQTNRSIYDGRKLSGEVLGLFESLPAEDNIRLYSAPVGSAFADSLTGYIIKGNEVQMNDRAFKRELLSWMRFNAKQINGTNDGLSYKVFGNPPLPRIMAKPIVRCFLKAAVQNKTDGEKIKSSSHLILFTTRSNTFMEWIGLGRTLQRFLLKTTEAGVACAYLNQPCEVYALAAEMRDLLPINREYPTLILRIGYAKPVPYSPRKNVRELLVCHG